VVENLIGNERRRRMSEVCCDLCAYWLPQFKECGNTHINKCTNKEHFVKVERNCGICEREIRADVIDEFVTKAYRKLGCSEKELYCVDVIDEIAEQMKAGEIAE
jgi:hypothetical protein